MSVLAKILVPVIERLAGAVETIQGNYADLLAKMDNVAAAVSEPNLVEIIGGVGTLIFAGLALWSLCVARKANRLAKEQAEEQNAIRLKDKILEQMSLVHRIIDLHDVIVGASRSEVQLRKNYTKLFEELQDKFLFSAYLPVLYNWYYTFLMLGVYTMGIECAKDIVETANKEYRREIRCMSLDFTDIASLSSEQFVERYQREREEYKRILEKLPTGNQNADDYMLDACFDSLKLMRKKSGGIYSPLFVRESN